MTNENSLNDLTQNWLIFGKNELENHELRNIKNNIFGIFEKNR